MVIKITGLELSKGRLEHFRNENKDLYHRHNLEGKLKVKVTERNISANTECDIFNVSDELKGKLVDLLDEIQDELNGIKSSFTSVGNEDSGRKIVVDGNVDFKDAKVKLTKGEYIIPKDWADNFFEATKVLDTMFDATKSMNMGVSKEQLDLIEKAIPTITVNVSNDTKNTIDELLCAMKKKFK